MKTRNLIIWIFLPLLLLFLSLYFGIILPPPTDRCHGCNFPSGFYCLDQYIAHDWVGFELMNGLHKNITITGLTLTEISEDDPHKCYFDFALGGWGLEIPIGGRILLSSFICTGAPPKGAHDYTSYDVNLTYEYDHELGNESSRGSVHGELCGRVQPNGTVENPLTKPLAGYKWEGVNCANLSGEQTIQCFQSQVCTQEQISPCFQQLENCRQNSVPICYYELEHCEGYNLENNLSACAQELEKRARYVQEEYGIIFMKALDETVCKDEMVQSFDFGFCTDEIGARVANISARAWEMDDSTVCDELANLKSMCYGKLIERLQLSLVDVIKYGLVGKYEDVCDKAPEGLEEKCFFNLAIHALNETYCSRAEPYFNLCSENIYVINKASELNVSERDLQNTVALNGSAKGSQLAMDSPEWGRLMSESQGRLQEDCMQLAVPASTRCFMYKLCEQEGLFHCYLELESRTARVREEALEKDDSSLCEQLGELSPLCYYDFARRLRITLDDVFRYGLGGQDEELCQQTVGALRVKCYFNLAIEKLDDSYCNYVGDYIDRCVQNVRLLKEGLPTEELRGVAQKRITASNNDVYKIYCEPRGHPEVVHPGSPGILALTNNGPAIDGTQLRLYSDFKLEDIDGCDNEAVPYSGGFYNVIHNLYDLCKLEYNNPSYNPIIEITYGGENAYVNPNNWLELLYS